MKARELTMAAHSDAVSLPEGDTDELPETMVTPRLMLRRCCRKGHPSRSIPPATVHRGNGVDVLGDTSAAELALVVGGTREGGCPWGAG